MKLASPPANYTLLSATPGAPSPMRALSKYAEPFRWVETDETAALLGSKASAVQVLGIVDGLVTAYDGIDMYQEGRQQGQNHKIVGGAVRTALGIGGALPSLVGAVSEGALGVYQIGEGLAVDDHKTVLTGITQLGVSVGMGMVFLGLRGPLGPALVLGSGVARVLGYAHHNKMEREKSDRS